MIARPEHCRPKKRQGRLGSMRHYMGARLHRKLFMAMGFSIFATIFACLIILHVGTNNPWHDDGLKHVQHFFSARFAEVWDDDEKRNRLANDAARAFKVELALSNTQGTVIGTYGGECKTRHFSFPVVAENQAYGDVTVCPTAHIRFEKVFFFVALGAAGLILWIMAGFLARRLGRPLLQLVEVTHEIGEGKLSSRARLGRQHDGEIGLLANSINDMAERIERQMKGQRELLAGVSHEIRTPLSRLRVLTEILRDQNVSEKSLTSIEREIDDINDLTGQLLASSRLEFESIDKVDLDPIEIAKTALARTNHEETLLQVEGTPRVVQGDATLIGRALTNLIENARRHGEGLTSLHLEFGENRLRFSAIDEGPGFRAEDLPRAFESFYRGTGSGKGSSSLGLGLALVRRIAQAHGGEALAENRAKTGDRESQNAARGALVSFTLPFDEGPQSVG